MGLRCIIGHDFGEIQTERDRRERGEEVIVTIREFRECDRCGDTRVVSENKEVRSAVTAEMDRSTPTERDDATDDRDARTRGPAETFDGVADEDVSADEDDGVILEDEPEERQPGEWPADETADDGDEDEHEPTPWPEVEGEDEGYAAEAGEGGDPEGVEFGSGLTPEAAASDAGGTTTADDGEEVVEATRGGSRGGFRRASPSPSPTGRQRSDAAETEFFCPECSFTTPTEDSSLRPGDICPSCRLGYLTERER